MADSGTAETGVVAAFFLVALFLVEGTTTTTTRGGERRVRTGREMAGWLSVFFFFWRRVFMRLGGDVSEPGRCW
jgi:hypothetical protein